MSLFDYPRITVKGTIQLSPGTANNDDYAANATVPSNGGPFSGQPLALMKSKLVEAQTYGMPDETFIAWAQQAQPFTVNDKPKNLIPAEWNYYGAMDMLNLKAQVIGVQMEPGDNSDPKGIKGANLAFSCNIADVNSEGSPPATQFFIQDLKLTQGSDTLLSGNPTKGAGQWLNFYRNVNLTADGGAGGYVYHVIKKGPNTTINLPGFEDPNIVGVIFRYCLYRPLIGEQSNEKIEEIYKEGKTNPATLEILGTFAPLYKHETILTTPVGRLMVSISDKTPIPTPGLQNNGGGHVALAPAVLVQNEKGGVSADFSGTFPDYYQGGDKNPKFDFGKVTLAVASGTKSVTIGAVEYADTDAGDEKGWIFDFEIPNDAQEICKDPNASFKLVHETLGDVLAETDYYFVSNQQAIYAEQYGSGKEFLNQGTTEPATISVYHRGQELVAGSCPPVNVWQYRSIPLQDPGKAEHIAKDLKPGEPIEVDTKDPGNFLFTFTIGDVKAPGEYAAFMNPPYITNWPSISLRILPNTEDFSKYYEDPAAKEPVGNHLLTFDVVFEKVLRTYYLLYPAMNKVFALNEEQKVAAAASGILKVTDPAMWMSSGYMPRTRDMSASRRTLLQAWCRKVKKSA